MIFGISSLIEELCYEFINMILSLLFSITGLFLNPKRQEVLDGTTLSWTTFSLVVTNPDEIQNFMTFIAPFQPIAWLGIGVMILSCSMVFSFVCFHCEGKY